MPMFMISFMNASDPQDVTNSIIGESHVDSNVPELHLPYLDNLVYQEMYHYPLAGMENSSNASHSEDPLFHEQKFFRFGEKLPVHISMKSHGQWHDLPDEEGKIWHLRISSTNAFSLNFLCDQFKLPTGSKLYVKGEHNHRDIFTPNTHNKPHGHFASMPLEGRYLDLEYYQPNDIVEEAQFRICSVIHGFWPQGEFMATRAKSRARASTGLNEEPSPANDMKSCSLGMTSLDATFRSEESQQTDKHGSADLKSAQSYSYTQRTKSLSAGGCHINAPQCDVAHAWTKQARATVLIMTNDGTGYCTGCMVNNVKQDGRQLLLTAKHCILDDKQYNYRYNIVVFNYQSSQCIPDDSENNGSTFKKRQDGKKGGVQSLLRQTVQGMKLLVMSPTTDVALVELEETIPESYQVYLAGWSTLNTPPASAACIHHPSGDLKKISIKDQPLQLLCVSPHCAMISTGERVIIHNQVGWTVSLSDAKKASHWYVDRWSRGVTEIGSSGCPLFDQDGFLIGHLIGGTSNCETQSGHDVFGRLSSSIANGLGRYLCPEHTTMPSKLSGVYLNDVRSSPIEPTPPPPYKKKQVPYYGTHDYYYYYSS